MTGDGQDGDRTGPGEENDGADPPGGSGTATPDGGSGARDPGTPDEPEGTGDPGAAGVGDARADGLGVGFDARAVGTRAAAEGVAGGGRTDPASGHTDGLRVLVFNWRDIDNPAAGGAEVFTHEVLDRLVDRGHEATLFSAAFEGCEDRAEVDGVEVVRAGGRMSVYGRAVDFYRRVSGEFDVVVDEINGPPFWTPLYADEPVVALIHHVVRDAWRFEMPFPVGAVGERLTDWWLRLYRSKPTVTVSTSTSRELSELGFGDVTVAPEGLSVDPLEEPPGKPDRPTFAFVGRMVEAKRPSHAVEAFDHVRRAYPGARLHMVGHGYMDDRLRAEAGENVTFHGYVPEERKFEILENSHVLLVPSVREGWALVVTEANAVGTPAVGYNVKGLRDSIRNGENGLLAAEDPMRLAQRALTVLGTDYDRYSRRALELARRHDWDRTADAVERVLREVVE